MTGSQQEGASHTPKDLFSPDLFFITFVARTQHVAAPCFPQWRARTTHAGNRQGGRRSREFGISTGLAVGENHFNTLRKLYVFWRPQGLFLCAITAVLLQRRTGSTRHGKVNRNYSHLFKQPSNVKKVLQNTKKASSSHVKTLLSQHFQNIIGGQNPMTWFYCILFWRKEDATSYPSG